MAEEMRSLKIKTGAVKRTTKEYLYYFIEQDKEQANLDKMEADSADIYDIKQQQNVVQESAMMIPETRKSLEALVLDLRSFMTDHGSSMDPDAEEVLQANEVLEAADKALSGAQS